MGLYETHSWTHPQTHLDLDKSYLWTHPQTHAQTYVDLFHAHLDTHFGMQLYQILEIHVGHIHTRWRRPIGCLKLQVSFRKIATSYRALLRKMTYKDKASYDPIRHPVRTSIPTCLNGHIHRHINRHIYRHIYKTYVRTHLDTHVGEIMVFIGKPKGRSNMISNHTWTLTLECSYNKYWVAKTHMIPEVADHFPQKSH